MSESTADMEQKATRLRGRKRKRAMESGELVETAEAKGRETLSRREVESSGEGNFLTRPFRAMGTYLGEVQAEARKVTWPTRPEVIRLTRIVIIVTILSSIVLGILSFFFSKLMEAGLNNGIILIGIIIVAVIVTLFLMIRSNRTTTSY